MNIHERLSGCLYGYAIGDAMGLGTEFMDRKEIRRRYPDGLYRYADIVRDAHRAPWKRGQFSHDTDIIVSLAHSLADREGPDSLDYAAKLSEWLHTAKIHDVSLGLRWIVGNPAFTADPEAVSLEYYTRTRPEISPNESLGRAMVIGLWDDNLEENVSRFCRLTHNDSRCVAASVVIGLVSNSLLWDKPEPPFEQLYGCCERIDRRATPYLELAREAGSIDEFDLDDEITFGSSLKTMALALWTLWHHTSPREALFLIVNEGGDADTNAALAIGLLGLKYGYEALPKYEIETLVGADIVQEAVDRIVPLFEDFARKRGHKI